MRRSKAEALCLLKYARGFDVKDDCTSTEGRTWLMGDVLHSRPLVINYGGSTTNPDVRLFFGSNDGYFRMIRNTTSGGNESGEEIWGFMPRAVMGNLSLLKADGEGAHPYGVDGVPSAYIFDSDLDGNIETADGDKVWVFFGLRRGGEAFYALDVSTPDSPSLLWRIESTDTDFTELGLSFSRPQVTMLQWDDDGNAATDPVTKPVVIFGGGYDLDKDRVVAGDPSPMGDDDEGNALFVVDAATGDLVWKATKGTSTATSTNFQSSNLLDSIPSDVALLDINDDGAVDRVYVGDTGGVLWRVNFTGNDRTQWNMLPLLSVGRHSEGGTGPDRRFLHRPDIALSNDGNGNSEAVCSVRGIGKIHWSSLFRMSSTCSRIGALRSAVVPKPEPFAPVRIGRSNEQLFTG
ncbi:MAG: PilC/PilY family type IV pilus protein [Candidatus Competibacteraceae bacterium]